MNYILFIIVFSSNAIQIDRIPFNNLRQCEAVKLQLDRQTIWRPFMASPIIRSSAECIRMF